MIPDPAEALKNCESCGTWTVSARPIPDAMNHIADAGKKVSALIDDLRNLGLDFSTEVFGQQLTVHVSLGTEKRI